jgi:hypothetical protein
MNLKVLSNYKKNGRIFRNLLRTNEEWEDYLFVTLRLFVLREEWNVANDQIDGSNYSCCRFLVIF